MLELQGGRGEAHIVADVTILPCHGDAWGRDIGDRIEGTWSDRRAQCKKALIMLQKSTALGNGMRSWSSDNRYEVHVKCEPGPDHPEVGWVKCNRGVLIWLFKPSMAEERGPASSTKNTEYQESRSCGTRGGRV